MEPCIISRQSERQGSSDLRALLGLLRLPQDRQKSIVQAWLVWLFALKPAEQEPKFLSSFQGSVGDVQCSMWDS